MADQAAQMRDAELICPIALVRQHCKIEDVETVTDEQLVLYREAAMELAERYSDQSLAVGSVIVEQWVGYPNGETVVRLDRPATDGIIQVSADGTVYTLVAPIGARSIKIGGPARDISGRPLCCNPCAQSMQTGASLRYASKLGCSSDAVAAGIRLGMLQFIAWAIANPGDCNDGAKGAKASGALTTWRMYRSEIGF